MIWVHRATVHYCIYTHTYLCIYSTCTTKFSDTNFFIRSFLLRKLCVLKECLRELSLIQLHETICEIKLMGSEGFSFLSFEMHMGELRIIQLLQRS